MTRGLRGEKRAIMSVWDDFIHRLEQDLAECRRDLELLESGQMQHRERRDGGAWVDTTQREPARSQQLDQPVAFPGPDLSDDIIGDMRS